MNHPIPAPIGPGRRTRSSAALLVATLTVLIVVGGPWAASTWAAPPSSPAAAAVHIGPLGVPSPRPSEALTGSGGSFTVQLSASPADVVQGSQLTLTVLISPLYGPPFSLSWSNLPSPCQGDARSSMSSSPSSFSCDPTQGGTFNPNVQATNATDVTQGNATTVSVYAPLSVTLSASPSALTVSQALTINYQVIGGVSPYALVWTNLPVGCAQGAPSSLSTNNPDSFGCSPSQASGSGASPVGLQVTDSATPSANRQSASATVTVYAALQVSLSVSPNSVTVGGQATFNYQITGGQGPYRLQWSGLPGNCAGNAPNSVSDNNPDSFPCSPSQSGNSQVGLQVTDSASPSNSANAPSQSLSVTSNGNNNNNNGNDHNNSNSNGGNGNNSSALSSLFSSLGSLFLIAAIVGIVVFALLVITAVSTLVTAVVVTRRLPKRSKGLGESVACPACGAAAPVSSKFCPECGKPMARGTPP